MAAKIYQKVLGEREVPGGVRLDLELRMADEKVPAILLLPGHAGDVPGALLLHGYTSRKETMADSMGRALLGAGVASLAIDLPLHGTRADPDRGRSLGGPLQLLGVWRLALEEARMGIRYLGARPEVDRERIGLIGYSLGSYLGVTLAADEPRVRAVVVAAGGDLPSDMPFARLARTVVDPTAAVRRLRGRPILISHGKRDRTVRPDQAERLYAAALEPREIRWWDSAHHLPQEAAEHAARWLKDHLPGNENGGRRAAGA